jgi:hypothetical protein
LSEIKERNMKRIFISMVCVCLLYSNSLAETDPFKPQPDPWMPKGVNSIKIGMTKVDVLAKAGKPDCKIMVKNPKVNPFGGPKEIREGWVYKSKNQIGYGAEIYFDSNGIVIGENGGFGGLDCAEYGK